MLWKRPNTRVSIEESYEIKVYPTNSILNGPITFNIPSQQSGMLWEIDVETQFKVLKGDADLSDTDNVSIVNNFSNALWELVDIVLGDRIDITQSMRNSYAYQSYFNTILNTDPNREDIMKATQLFVMDSGKTREDSMIFSGANIKNKGASQRAKKIANSNPLTIIGKLHCPLINCSKALPTALPLRITLTKNSDAFLLLSSGSGYKVHLSSVHLRAKYIKPAPPFLALIENRLMKEPAPYHVCKPELIVRPIPEGSHVLRLNHIFPGKLPHHAFFCVQTVASFEGTFTTNPFAFVPFTKFQFYCDGKPYFVDTLEASEDDDYAPYLHQLYKSLGMDLHGQCLVNSDNFEQNFILGLTLSPDREGTVPHGYISPQLEASTRLEIELGETAEEDLVLIVYALYDRLININGDRAVDIIE
eukprot:sb/3465077/